MSYPHQVGDYACPCEPTYYLLCSQCGQDEEGPPADPDCWQCAGMGEVEVSAGEAERAKEMDSAFLHVVHRWMPGDPNDGAVFAINTRSGGERWDDNKMLADDPVDDGLGNPLE